MLGVLPAAASAQGGLHVGDLELGFGQDLAGEPVEVRAQAGRLRRRRRLALRRAVSSSSRNSSST